MPEMYAAISPPLRAKIDAADSGNNTLVAAVAGKKIRVIQFGLILDGAVTVQFQSGANGTALTGAMAPGTNGGLCPPFCPWGLLETAAGELLNLRLSAAVGVRGWLTYQLVD